MGLCPEEAGAAQAPEALKRKVERLEYVGGDGFNLSFMHHTGQWVEIYPDLSLDECLAAVRDDPWFHP